ncbi:MAG: DNA polymerase IV [Chloroflexi bacterium]|nr:DNA polymerase IV [Chloroflexota bacterium]
MDKRLSSSKYERTEWQTAVLHLDMDAFFVNVHILDHPEDAGVPLVVGGQPDKRGVVASASYEARQFGVRSAMPTGTAVRLCPSLKIVSSNWEQIRASSKQVMAILREYGSVEQMSVDEAYIDLTDQDQPEQIAEQICVRVKAETSLPCSVGLATSKLVAKVASDFDKPEGFTVVNPGTEAAFLAPMPTRAIHGIGPRTAEKLAAMGVNTCVQLAVADMVELKKRFGNQAESLQRRAQGIDNRTVHSERGQAKSISQEWTFNTDVNDTAVLLHQLEKMCDRVAKSLQKNNLVAHTVNVKFRWADFTTFTRQKSLDVGIDQANDLFRVAKTIWEENWPPGQRMRLLGVGVSNLETPTMRQLGFDFS